VKTGAQEGHSARMLCHAAHGVRCAGCAYRAQASERRQGQRQLLPAWSAHSHAGTWSHATGI